jgi:hypothetical protein
MADAAGYLAGSLVAMSDLPLFSDLRVLLALSLGQTAVVYLIYLRCYHPARRPARRPAPRPAPGPRTREALLTSD